MNTPFATDFLKSMAPHAHKAAELLKALANPHRLQILCVLGDAELSVGELNEHLPLSQSALSQHLAKLRSDELVTTRRESQTIYYRIQPGPAQEIIQILHKYYCAN
jgi:ArsR family transcriptional regulator, virulence genes transcriptional regulator